MPDVFDRLIDSTLAPRNSVVRDPRDLEAVFDVAVLERVGWGLQ